MGIQTKTDPFGNVSLLDKYKEAEAACVILMRYLDTGPIDWPRFREIAVELDMATKGTLYPSRTSYSEIVGSLEETLRRERT